MHATFFSLKRAYQRTLYGVARHITSIVGLTPARFDLLHAIRTHPMKVVTQSTLRRILGVTAPTVSRMARSLEDLGFVTRRRSPVDARQILVSLTALAQQALGRADVHDFGGALDFAFESALSATFFAESRFEDFFTFNTLLERVRRAFFDTATLYYPWHPDD